MGVCLATLGCGLGELDPTLFTAGFLELRNVVLGVLRRTQIFVEEESGGERGAALVQSALQEGGGPVNGELLTSPNKAWVRVRGAPPSRADPSFTPHPSQMWACHSPGDTEVSLCVQECVRGAGAALHTLIAAAATTISPTNIGAGQVLTCLCTRGHTRAVLLGGLTGQC